MDFKNNGRINMDNVEDEKHTINLKLVQMLYFSVTLKKN